MEQVVFRDVNSQGFECEIVEQDDHYQLKVEGQRGKWRAAYFNKDEHALDAVVTMIRRYGHPIGNVNGFLFIDKTAGVRTHVTTLGRVMYAAYHRKRTDTVKNVCVRYVDGDVCNLRRNNLRRNEEVKRKKINGKECILIRRTQSDGSMRVAVVNYEPELYRILDSCGWSYEDSKKCFYTGGSSRRGRFKLPFVVWAYYTQGLTLKNWREKCSELQRMFAEKNLSIDHKKCCGHVIGKWDCRIENLQAMERTVNRNKGTCTQVIPKNCMYIPTVDGAICGRVDTSAHTMDVYRMTNDPTAEEIQQLRHFCKTGELTEETNYTTIDLSDAEAIEITLAAYAESKFYQEVYSLC